MRLSEAILLGAATGIEHWSEGGFFDEYPEPCAACALGMAAIGSGIGCCPDVYSQLMEKFPELATVTKVPGLRRTDGPRQLLGMIAAANDYDSKSIDEIVEALQEVGL